MSWLSKLFEKEKQIEAKSGSLLHVLEENAESAWISIGRAERFSKLPCEVKVGDTSFFLTKSNNAYALLSRVCPHMGGRVEIEGESFACPYHGWTFEAHTGACTSGSVYGLTVFPVEARDGALFAKLPTNRPRSSGRGAKKRPWRNYPVQISLHAHACLEIKSSNFSLLMDPWLDGPAFLGAWTQYPPPVVKTENLKPNAIWISHEHSDHYHEATLVHFSRTTPIYFPDFPNRRLSQRLLVLGFTDLHPMAFGHCYELAPNFKITCFEPGGFWNDSSVLIEIDKLRILNLNDSGVNYRVARQIAPVDVVTSAFAGGASGYPLTWQHLSDFQKDEIIRKSNAALLQMLRDAATLYGARRILPFAGHFVLWHPSQRHYMRRMKVNSIADVEKAFADIADVGVVNLLPGDSWNLVDDTVQRAVRERPFTHDRLTVEKYVEAAYNEAAFAKHHPTGRTISREKIEKYLLQFNQTAEISLCEDLTGILRLRDTEVAIAFEVKSGTLKILSTAPEYPSLTIEIPGGVLGAIIDNNLSWDEAHIGYWCHFDRHPDVYHAGFWRMIQAPYFLRSMPAANGVDEGANILQLLELYGEPAERVLNRYGLYCVGCQRAPSETLTAAAQAHGLGQSELTRMIAELRAATAQKD